MQEGCLIGIWLLTNDFLKVVLYSWLAKELVVCWGSCGSDCVPSIAMYSSVISTTGLRVTAAHGAVPTLMRSPLRPGLCLWGWHCPGIGPLLWKPVFVNCAGVQPGCRYLQECGPVKGWWPCGCPEGKENGPVCSLQDCQGELSLGLREAPLRWEWLRYGSQPAVVSWRVEVCPVGTEASGSLLTARQKPAVLHAVE